MEKQRFVILGGGTAGWMAANLIAHHWADKPIEVCLVESPNIGIIGVGEGSTPTLKRFFEDLNIPESEWMPECNATYKVSIRFEDWSPGSGIDSYAHPFISQLDTHSQRPFYVNCMTRRLGLNVDTTPSQFLFNGWLADKGLAPKTPANFPFRIDYGYHFDSGLLGEFLKKRAVKHGVIHKQLDVERVEQSASGDIASLTCRGGEVVEGDFFIDCSGFRAVLIQQTLKVPFESFKSNLFNDAAVAMPSSRLDPAPVETKATALTAGWAWQIPLQHRTGNGYVFSSSFISADKAETELRKHLGMLDADIETRHLKMNVGQVAEHWHKNCLALGLSQGFIEPLEATALHLVQLGIEFFIEHYEAGGFTSAKRAEYNAVMRERFDRVRDYIVAHYKLNTRDDSDYWRENRANMQLSQPLRELLDVWYRGKDLTQYIESREHKSHFGSASWHCMLAGYGVFPSLAESQPGGGDMFVEHDLARLFEGCALNFERHDVALSRLNS